MWTSGTRPSSWPRLTIFPTTSLTYIFSIKNTEISVDFWDPSQFLAKARKITYFWFVDSVPFGQSSEVCSTVTWIRNICNQSVNFQFCCSFLLLLLFLLLQVLFVALCLSPTASVVAVHYHCCCCCSGLLLLQLLQPGGA